MVDPHGGCGFRGLRRFIQTCECKMNNDVFPFAYNASHDLFPFLTKFPCDARPTRIHVKKIACCAAKILQHDRWNCKICKTYCNLECLWLIVAVDTKCHGHLLSDGGRIRFVLKVGRAFFFVLPVETAATSFLVIHSEIMMWCEGSDDPLRNTGENTNIYLHVQFCTVLLLFNVYKKHAFFCCVGIRFKWRMPKHILLVLMSFQRI